MANNRLDKISNSLCTGLHRRMQMPIEKLLSSNPELKLHAPVALEAFLQIIRLKCERIQSYVNNNERSKELVISEKSGSMVFTYTIMPNLNSICEVQVINSISVEIPNQFIDSRIFPAKGYVYFLKSEYGYKIGCAKNIDKRINFFGVKLPFKVELHSYIYCKEFCQFERELHKLLSHKRIDGEWFSLDDNDFFELDRYIENTYRKRILSVEGGIKNG